MYVRQCKWTFLPHPTPPHPVNPMKDIETCKTLVRFSTRRQVHQSARISLQNAKVPQQPFQKALDLLQKIHGDIQKHSGHLSQFRKFMEISRNTQYSGHLSQFRKFMEISRNTQYSGHLSQFRKFMDISRNTLVISRNSENSWRYPETLWSSLAIQKIHGDIQKYSGHLSQLSAPVMKQHPKGPKPAVAILSITLHRYPTA